MKTIVDIKTVIVDLDRTLLHTDKTISDYTLSVLKKCKEKGIQIIVATARPERTAEEYCEMIGCDAAVFSNGARVIVGDRKLEHRIPLSSAEKLLTALSLRPDLRITLETGDLAYSNKPIEDYETILSDDLAGVAKAEGALKILVHIDSEDIIKTELPEDLYYTVSNGYLMQIMSKKATKWNGILAALEVLGLSPAETAYFGDDNDDIEPIKMCGTGVAVSNGIDEAKKAADYIAESNDEDGVAKFIEKMIHDSGRG